MILEWIYYALLLALLIFGWFSTIANVPGLWVMVAASAAYGALTRWQYMALSTLVVLVAVAMVAEIVETVAGGAGAKRAGGSKRGAVGAIVGGILGAFFLAFLVPIFPVGMIVGACLGSLLGASIVELLLGKGVRQSLRIGAGAFKGRFVGIMAKLVFGFAIFVVAAIAAFPV